MKSMLTLIILCNTLYSSNYFAKWILDWSIEHEMALEVGKFKINATSNSN